ncbi:hypothetical protein [Chelatococcus reniformis]|uniref:Glycosyl transferase n=1 Tax=Chelatococcus reniformis TaxID=1494448 RepID=A0A916XFB1_9HYPH|nr:hypothetical protein [Chelatococcus reniformis]GGC67722.1 hypothetical protein GCM10010994_27910 [Chelatococcus reniformis]
MPKVHCYTSASFSYLDRARVLATTLKAFHPDWEFTLCLCDQEPRGWMFDVGQEPFDRVVRISELALPDPTRFLFDHDVVELCTAVKAPMLERMLAEGAEKVVYLDPDIAVFSELTPLVELLDEQDIVLTPHLLVPETERGAILDNEVGSLKHGIYNLGFIAVANRPSGRRFAAWWGDRLRHHCFDDIPNGLFTDQRWCDHVPAFFEGVHILRDPGYNAASWNLSQRPITIGTDGVIRADGSQLRFFHFTKVNWAGELMLERYARDHIDVFELLTWYRARLAECRAEDLPANYWAFAQYSNGAPIEAAHRDQYRVDLALREQHADPFVAGPGIFA